MLSLWYGCYVDEHTRTCSRNIHTPLLLPTTYLVKSVERASAAVASRTASLCVHIMHRRGHMLAAAVSCVIVHAYCYTRIYTHAYMCGALFRPCSDSRELAAARRHFFCASPVFLGAHVPKYFAPAACRQNHGQAGFARAGCTAGHLSP